MAKASKIIEYVLSQVGYEEGNNNWNKYAEDIDNNYPLWYGSCGKKQNKDWCSVFVDDAFIQTFGLTEAHRLLNRPDNNWGAVVKYAYNYLDKIGRTGKVPKLGATVYFQNSAGLCHTGIVTDFTAETVTTVEGNAGMGSRYVKNNTYNRKSTYIYGYGYPDYEAEPVPEPYKRDGIYTVTCKGPLRLRTGPSTKDEILLDLSNGDKVHCLKVVKKDGKTWLRVDGYCCAVENGNKYIE